MSHDDDALIILSVVISPDVADMLDSFIGLHGSTREEVASHYISVPHGGKRQKCGKEKADD